MKTRADLILAGPDIVAAAAAIANARGSRHGVPAVANILEVLPPALLDKVLTDAEAALAAAPIAAADEVARLRAWVADLQSGLWVNCVYCGHRYGPGETTPVSMADALKAHVERCPEHPMAALRAETERLTQQVADYEEVLQSKRETIRAIDVALHGEAGAARQASGCDLIEPARALRAVADLAVAALASISTACGNVIVICEQRPADNARHLASWRLVKETADQVVGRAVAVIGTGPA